MSLEDLLRMKINGTSGVTGEPVKFSPHFTVSVQGEIGGGVHFIIHADSYNSETLDFIVFQDEIKPYGEWLTSQEEPLRAQ